MYGVTCPRIRFTLADRGTMMYPVLLGRKLLAMGFVVDVSRHIVEDIEHTLHREKMRRLARERATLKKGDS